MYRLGSGSNKREAVLMPTYEFRCKTDKSLLEIQQGFYDNTIPNCPLCGEEMSKVISATPVIFNASGFYKTDNR